MDSLSRSGEVSAKRQRREPGEASDLADHPVREYVAAMARELAAMARWDGDEPLGSIDIQGFTFGPMHDS